MKLVVKLKNDSKLLVLSFQTEQERDRHFDLIRHSMTKVTLDIWSSPGIVLKIAEIVYIKKEV